MRHDIHELIALFGALFGESDGTELVRGDKEPVYLPRDAAWPQDRVVFAHGFFASALHEVAHWCVAGRARRRLPDYGYWYQPDGRSPDEQRAFEAVEVKPQALEWLFSRAADLPFHFSADNLDAGGAVTSAAWLQFQRNVAAQAQSYLTRGLPARAARFARALSERYGTTDAWRDGALYRID